MGFNNTQVVQIDPIRSLAFGSIAATYNKVGGVLDQPVRLITFVNDTDAGVFFSDDGVTDKFYLPAGTFKLLDICTNRFHKDVYWVVQAGTQWWVRYASAPSKNSVYIECLWGQ